MDDKVKNIAYGAEGDNEDDNKDDAIQHLLFTPDLALLRSGDGRKQLDFSGFGEKESYSTSEKVLYRRILGLEWHIKGMMERMVKMEKKQEIIHAENTLLKKDCEELKEKLGTNEKKVQVNDVKVEQLNDRHNEWKKEQEQDQVNFKTIMDKQFQEKENEVAKTVIKVIKEKPDLVRDTVEKKMCCFWSQRRSLA